MDRCEIGSSKTGGLGQSLRPLSTRRAAHIQEPAEHRMQTHGREIRSTDYASLELARLTESDWALETEIEKRQTRYFPPISALEQNASPPFSRWVSTS